MVTPYTTLISHSFSHCSSIMRSSCKMFASDRELIHKYMAVSSAKSLTLDITFSGRSFMYAKKRIGPRTEPCRTPDETGIELELVPLETNGCFLLSKKTFIHLRVSPPPPNTIGMAFLVQVFVGNFIKCLTKVQ